MGSRDSAVCIATGDGLYDRGVGVQVAGGSLIFLKASHPMGTTGCFPGVKAAGACS
jgi:hypothetical protein